MNWTRRVWNYLAIGRRPAASEGSRRLRWFSIYLVSLMTVAVATGCRLGLDPILGEHHPFTLYFAAVTISAWYGGFWPGAFSIVLSYFAADWFFIAPRFAFNWPHD